MPEQERSATNPVIARWRALPMWVRVVVQWSTAFFLVFLMGLAFGDSPGDAARSGAWIWLLVAGLTALGAGWRWAWARRPRRL